VAARTERFEILWTAICWDVVEMSHREDITTWLIIIVIKKQPVDSL
jgi:hypothetical protein